MNQFFFANSCHPPIVQALRKIYLNNGYCYKDCDKVSAQMDFIIVFEYDLKHNYLSFSDLIEKRLNNTVKAMQKFKTLEAHYYQIPSRTLKIVLILPYLKSIYGSSCFDDLLTDMISLITNRLFSESHIVEVVIDRNLYSPETEIEYWADQIYNAIRKSNDKISKVYFGLRPTISQYFFLVFRYYNLIAVLAGTMFILTRLFWSKMT